jgi:SpoVK/Ycf46/Vps4 family AAA+-type ATPase
VNDILEKLHRIDAVMREGAEVRPGFGTMLFYGPPGTGKSEFARYLSDELGRELVARRACDLLSMYVGESEKNIANAFKEAERENSVLLIDEADSFIYSREIAVRPWESTMVNEFLTALEKYRGFCICTTNRMKHLDPAAMRRFSFKAPFTYAKPRQAEALYELLLAPIAAGRMSDNARMRLSSLPRLTPGDFHAVRNQYWLLNPREVTHEQLIDALIAEQNAKLEDSGRRIGFCN